MMLSGIEIVAVGVGKIGVAVSVIVGDGVGVISDPSITDSSAKASSKVGVASMVASFIMLVEVVSFRAALEADSGSSILKGSCPHPSNTVITAVMIMMDFTAHCFIVLSSSC